MKKSFSSCFLNKKNLKKKQKVISNKETLEINQVIPVNEKIL